MEQIQIPEGSVAIPLKAGEPDGPQVIIPNFDMSKVNVTKVVLQMKHPVQVKPNGTRKQRRTILKPFMLRWIGTLDTVAELKTKMSKAKAGDVYYVREAKLNYFWHPHPTEYMSAFLGVTLRPTVDNGAIKSCEVTVHMDAKIGVDS